MRSEGLQAADFSSCLKNRKQTGSSAAIEADLRLRVFIFACVWLNTMYQTLAERGLKDTKEGERERERERAQEQERETQSPAAGAGSFVVSV